MTFRPDPRLDESRTIPMAEVVDRLGIAGLRRQGAELVGPCPICGGRDRFAINTRTNRGLCRKCGLKFGDQAGLVMEVNGLGLRDALKWLVGEAVADLDPAEVERRRARARAAERKQAEEAARYRQWAIDMGRTIWKTGQPLQPGDPVMRYLAGRGLPGELVTGLAPVLRFQPDLAYRKKIGGELVELHRGPAMLARIDSEDESVRAVHCTWINADHPGAKAEITARMDANKGAPWPPKLVFGSKKGGAITLTLSRAPVLVMGEGIETTLTALAAQPMPRADYWCGVDLGNMAGRMQRLPGVKWSGLPDMTDTEAWVPPPWVERLIYIQDGDSDPKPTRAKLEAGLKRAMEHRPGLRGQIVQAGAGVDLNDLVKGIPA
ncbi:hypothetical protein N0B44_15675 [Roseibacterium beibuensis]|uniref:Uncharacterized protein n=1 Tax=[Roseibacterium] beibuensis TaxID=1193142 RepID=A0ABP9LCE3_9RHOB|nr:primase-helicase zinc-binding domain-containing protein [Roseibacterium beibuensis]MCS6624358.1 hypothetical protein [Roseibacterium beibuensis]